MYKCEYCGDEIKGEYAKFDEVGKVYFHDGPSLSKLFRMAPGPIRIPVEGESAETQRETQRLMPEDLKLCAQLYKGERTVKGNSVLLNRVKLEGLASS